MTMKHSPSFAYDDEECPAREPGLMHTQDGTPTCAECGITTYQAKSRKREPSDFTELLEQAALSAVFLDDPALNRGRLEWAWVEAQRLGQTRDRVVLVEEGYRPGLDNPVRLDESCPRFVLFPRVHRPSSDFERCEFCGAPLERPDRSDSGDHNDEL